MSQLITSEEVIALAFTDGEYISPDVIATSHIEAATYRWIVPVAGQALLDAVAEGSYPELLEDYLKPAIAIHTRLLVQPRLNASTAQLGLSVATGSSRKAADRTLREELLRSLRVQARVALRRLSDYLDANAQLFAEYDKAKNILKRCSIGGGIALRKKQGGYE